MLTALILLCLVNAAALLFMVLHVWRSEQGKLKPPERLADEVPSFMRDPETLPVGQRLRRATQRIFLSRTQKLSGARRG